MRKLLLAAVAVLGLGLVTERQVTAQGPTQTVVFLHGIFSESSTWDDTSARLHSRLVISPPVLPNLPDTDHFGDQASWVQSQFGSVPNESIFIGHSNGGIVAREWSRLHPVRGIITVGTPHNGAPLLPHWFQWANFMGGGANWWLTYLSAVFNQSYSEWYWVLAYIENAVYWLTDFSWWSVIDLGLTLGFDHAYPVWEDMHPYSLYLGGLNSQTNLDREATSIPTRIGVANIAHNYFWAGVGRTFAPEYGDEIAVAMYGSAYLFEFWAGYIYSNADISDFDAMEKADVLWGIASFILSIDPYYCRMISTFDFSLCRENDTKLDWVTQLYPGATSTLITGSNNDGPVHGRETRAWYAEDVLFGQLVFGMNVSPIGGGGSPASLEVNLQASNGQFVVAEGGGGGVVNANRDIASTWETFVLVDLNGGQLRDGDPVAFQAVNGQYLQAINGGGGDAAAAGNAILSWETFTIVGVDHPGDVIQNGDAVAIQVLSGHYFSAENGGGSAVFANGGGIGAWEVFHLIIR